MSESTSITKQSATVSIRIEEINKGRWQVVARAREVAVNKLLNLPPFQSAKDIGAVLAKTELTSAWVADGELHMVWSFVD